MSHDRSLLWRFRWSLFISSTSFPLSSIFYPHSFLCLFLFFHLVLCFHLPPLPPLPLPGSPKTSSGHTEPLMDSLTGGQAKDVWMRSSNSTTTTTQSGERHFGLREKPGFTQAFFIFLLRIRAERTLPHLRICICFCILMVLCKYLFVRTSV